MIDATAAREVGSTYAPLLIKNELLLASETDIQRAKSRLDRLHKIATNDSPRTRRMAELARQVQKKMATGSSELEACLTGYARSGNRSSRLLPKQEEAIENVVAQYWLTGKARLKKDVAYELELECARMGVAPGGRKRLYKRLREETGQRRALATGGLRAYQAIRPRTDPRSISLPPIGYGQILHIDSSDVDVRLAPDAINEVPAIKAKFYVGMDGATGDSMAHSLIFGPARTDGIALLIREYVRRHKMLPQMIHVDRGPENKGKWITQFCEMKCISLRYSPTAGSAWNSVAESAIKHVNSQVAHKLPGSTQPDQMGRRVDGRFKSDRNAALDFSSVRQELETFFYGDMPGMPGATGHTPAQRKADALRALGAQGTPCQLDDDLRVQTSMLLPIRGKPDPRRGIRTAEGWFSSDELLRELRVNTPNAVRSDCADPSTLYVSFGGRWVKAFHSRVQEYAQMSPEERLWELMYAPLRRARTRRTLEETYRRRHGRRGLAELTARDHVPAAPDPIAQLPSEELIELPALLQGYEAFEEREDF